jgi:hypothetical protein
MKGPKGVQFPVLFEIMFFQMVQIDRAIFFN